MVDDELEPLITRCPNCSTQFRVTENQLAIASGRVRCGACLTVFQGTDHLIPDEGTRFSTGDEADAALDALLDELEPGEQLEIEGPPARSVAGSPEEGTRLYGGFEEDAETREVTKVDLAEADLADVGEHVQSADYVPSAEPSHDDTVPDADEGIASDADNGIDDQQTAGAAEATEPPPTADTSDADYERWLDRDSSSIDQLVEEVVASGRMTARGRSDAVPVAASDASPAAGYAAVSGAGEISFAPEPRRWWAGGVAALFIVLLALQTAYLQLPEWSREPSLRPAYEVACGWLGCELPEMRALTALRTRNLVVRSHPGTSGALIVDAAIVNTASYAQRFPDLELRFTSVTGELVAGRRFAPDEYLPADFEGERAMPPNTPIQVSLEIVDPGPDAVNYTLSFR